MTTVQIPLRRRDGSIRAYTLVDAEDEAWVNQWRWCLSCHGYVHRGTNRDGRQHTIFLHRELLGLPWRRERDGLEGDHINRDRLDNRRSNLRSVSHRGNQENKPSYRNSASQYRGVHWTKGRWAAAAKWGGKRYHLGYYMTELDAARAVARWRAEHMPGTVEDAALLGPAPPAVASPSED